MAGLRRKDHRLTVDGPHDTLDRGWQRTDLFGMFNVSRLQLPGGSREAQIALVMRALHQGNQLRAVLLPGIFSDIGRYRDGGDFVGVPAQQVEPGAMSIVVNPVRVSLRFFLLFLAWRFRITRDKGNPLAIG